MTTPKEGTIGAGTGGYTGSLGNFKEHLGYGSSLFGEGGGGGHSSGMATPEVAASKIASKFLHINYHTKYHLPQRNPDKYQLIDTSKRKKKEKNLKFQTFILRNGNSC